MKCPQCKRNFPPELITRACINGEYVEMCPLCYAKEYEALHGIPWEPTGEIASEMYERALEMDFE